MDNEKIITLEEYENENGCIDSYEAAAIIKLLCMALYKLHKDKITYRELCPGNILLVYGNGKQEEGFTEVKLAESAAQRKYRDGAAEDTVLMGIERYAAPEQYGFSQSVPATDIFATGVIFNEMLTGKTPEEENTSSTVCAYIIRKCCNLDWKKRYKSVHALIKDINWYMSHKEKGSFSWNIYKNRKFLIKVAVIALCAIILTGTGFAIQYIKKNEKDKTQDKLAEKQEKEFKEEYQKYTLDSRGITVYYPPGFHYSDKTEGENVFVYFSPDTGSEGMIAMSVSNNSFQYTLEEAAKMMQQVINNAFIHGDEIYNETGEDYLKLYYKTSFNGKDAMAGLHMHIEEENEIILLAFGVFLPEMEDKYREYLDAMIEKIEY